MRVCAKYLAVMASLVLLSGCVTQAETAKPDVTNVAMSESLINEHQKIDKGEQEIERPANDNAASHDEAMSQVKRTSEIYPGSGQFFGPASTKSTAKTAVSSTGDITLNFVNADIKDVAKAILGDYLKLNYALGSGVQGTVTIETSRPLSKEDVLPSFEQALRLNGMALVVTNGIYKIVAISDAPHETGVNVVRSTRNSDVPGYGVEIVPMKYIGADEMKRLLEPLAPAQDSIHADTSRNVLMIQGTQQERATMLDNIALFDVDWLSGMSFALYTPQYMDAQGLAKELGEVLGGRNSPLSSLVKLVPIDRLNAVLAISPQVRYLSQLQKWVERLDKPGQASDRRIFVYYVQNGRATDLAGVLLKVLGGGEKAKKGQIAATYSPDNMGGAPSLGPSGMPRQGSDVSQEASDYYDETPMPGEAGQGISVDGMQGLTITADEANNALVIMGTASEYSVVESALRQLDTVPLQVMLEASIAEVTLSDSLKYGVQYFFKFGNNNEIRLSEGNSAAISAAYPAFSYSYASGDNIKIILDALSSVTHVDVISSPHILVLNNQTATLQVGDQVPVATTTSQSTTAPDSPIVSSIQYHDTGVILKVTPRVNRGGMVMMDISQEVSNVAKTESSAIDSPTIQQRKISSTVAVQDNETIALGGLMKESRTQSNSGIPLLKDIPVLGNLFKSTGKDSGKTELMVLITPRVIDNMQRARTVTEELRQKLPSVQTLFEAR